MHKRPAASPPKAIVRSRNRIEPPASCALVMTNARAVSPDPVQGAELVAVGIAEISKIEFARGAFAHARRVFAALAAIGDAGSVPRVGLLGGGSGTADGAALGRGRRLAVD